jgi:hypothetical protein
MIQAPKRSTGRTYSYEEYSSARALENAQIREARIALWAKTGWKESGSDGLFAILLSE